MHWKAETLLLIFLVVLLHATFPTQGQGNERPPGNRNRLPRPPNPSDFRLPRDTLAKINRKCRQNDCKTLPPGRSAEAGEKRKLAKEARMKNLEKDSFRGRRDAAEREAERLVKKTQRVKKALLRTLGINAADVEPADDGFLFDHDLWTEELMDSALNNGRTGRRRKRGSVAYFDDSTFDPFKWNTGQPISYFISPDFSSGEAAEIVQGMNTMNSAVSCLSFTRTNSPVRGPHIEFQKFNQRGLCGFSPIGKISVNDIFINPGCGSIPGRVMHEVMHTLGAAHTHNRLDRDRNLRMDWDNVSPADYDFFAYNDWNIFTTFGTPYSPLSILHYNAFHAAINPSIPTMVPVDSSIPVSQLGQRSRLLPSDVSLLERAYCCPSCRDTLIWCGYYANVGLAAPGSPTEEPMKIFCPKSSAQCC